MSDIVHIVRATKDGVVSIIGVFDFDEDAESHKAVCAPDFDKIEIDAWLVQGDSIFDTYQLTKVDLYAVGSTVLYKEEGERRMGEVVYCNEDQRHGFQNVLYRVERVEAGRLEKDYVLGSDIIGNITKKPCQSENLV